MASLNPTTGILGIQRASHLLRRATFGPDISSINSFATMTAQDAVTALFVADPDPAFPVDPLNGTDWVYPNTKHPDTFNDTLSRYTCSWWMENARASGMNLTERMIWFYYTHFPMILSRIEGRPQFSIDYLRLLRYYALGNYKELTRAICIDNAMLVHLDGNLNVKGVPQENFAREFLELYTVGKGDEVGVGDYTTFTEQDVQAATKVLTGWGIDPTFQTVDALTGIPSGKVKSNNGSISSQHDISTKQFSYAFNNTQIQTTGIVGADAAVQSVADELDELIDMIFNSSHAAKNICRRIYREFVYFDITSEIESDIIEPLAAVLVANDYEIKSVLEVLLQSEHFYDEDTIQTDDNNSGAIIKSPMDLVIGSIRLFNLQVPDKDTDLDNHYSLYAGLINQLSHQGLELFEPYDVAGHDPYFQLPDFQRYWISSNYLANRYKFIEYLISGLPINQSLLQLDIVQFVRDNCSNPANATTLVQELVNWLFPIAIDADRFNYFRDAVLLDQLSAINWSVEWNNYITSNNDMNVRLQLEALALAMMQSPEYQLY